jgi:hypothetical protein
LRSLFLESLTIFSYDKLAIFFSCNDYICKAKAVTIFLLLLVLTTYTKISTILTKSSKVGDHGLGPGPADAQGRVGVALRGRRGRHQ